jgi:hypothetical protein
MHPDDPTSGAAFTTEGEGAEHAGPRDLELAPQLALKASLRLSNRRQGQKNRPVAEIRPADHLLNPIQENRPRRFKQHLLVIGMEALFFRVIVGTQELRSKGIDNFEERELIEIGVAGANSSDAMFTHKNGGVRVVEQIAGKMRQLQNDLLRNVGVPFCRGQELRGLARRAAPQRNSTPPLRSMAGA